MLFASAALAQDEKKEDIPDPECDGGTSDMVKCLAEATAKWDKRLNAAYREALNDKETPKAQREQLRKAQRLWLQYRDANCEYYALGEGSICAAQCRKLPVRHDQGSGQRAGSRAAELSGQPRRDTRN